MISALALLSVVTPEAAACGGFFCNNIEPIEQAGEDIVFEVDFDANQTTMHVQVEYDGPPMEFAWVVPVSGEPDLFISNDALFNTLRNWTEPRFWMNWEFEGECQNMYWDERLDADAGGVPEPSPPSAEDDGVNVLAQETVGPYDTVTLQAESSAALVAWLQDNGYQVPSLLEPVLAPYVGQRRNFVALRLTNGADTGDLAPLGMRYGGVRPAVPIQLTSIAATPDMELNAYILGPGRAVPTNYLHVELNEAAVDWFAGGANYRDVLTRAADEAGGHAFSTDFAGSTTPMRNLFYQDSWQQLDLAGSTSAADFVGRVIFSGIPASSTILEIFQTHVQVPAGYDAQSVYNCPDCYLDELATANPDFDAAAAAQEMQDRVIEPLRQIDAMFDRTQTLTRLGSTVSPAEMTIDPEFGFNLDMDAEVSNIHEARLVHECQEDSVDPWWDSPRRLILSDNTEILIPSEEWLNANGITASEYLASLQEPAAARIEQTGETGMPTVIFDGRDTIDGFVDQHNEETEGLESRGGGCSSTGLGAASWGLLGVLGLFARRRR